MQGLVEPNPRIVEYVLAAGRGAILSGSLGTIARVASACSSA